MQLDVGPPPFRQAHPFDRLRMTLSGSRMGQGPERVEGLVGGAPSEHTVARTPAFAKAPARHGKVRPYTRFSECRLHSWGAAHLLESG